LPQPLPPNGRSGLSKKYSYTGHLQEKWRGPFKVILAILMAAKLAGFPSRVHVQNLKLAAPQKTY
jgi:hypothetical protein